VSKTTCGLHPLLDNADALAIVNDMLAAQSEAEWNACLARLVTFLFIAATPQRTGERDQARTDHLTYKMIQLHALIERGPRLPANRRPHSLQAREDARNLHIQHAPSLAHAIAELEWQERPPAHVDTLAKMEAWRRAQQDRLRKRIERAEKAGGFRLPRRAKRGANPNWDSNE
jgi:hypothetical protein